MEKRLNRAVFSYFSSGRLLVNLFTFFFTTCSNKF